MTMSFETAASPRAARWTLGLVLAGLALAARPARAQDPVRYQVIVNASNPVTELDRAEVSRWFLKQATKWPDGKVVVPLDQSSRSEVRAFFCAGIHRQSTQAIETYWQKQIFSGRTVPPFVKVGDAEVMAYVSGNAGAIAYVKADATLIPGVKAIKIKE
jgi:ABC-type phosphate transport system substrate-binding protein